MVAVGGTLIVAVGGALIVITGDSVGGMRNPGSSVSGIGRNKDCADGTLSNGILVCGLLAIMHLSSPSTIKLCMSSPKVLLVNLHANAFFS